MTTTDSRLDVAAPTRAKGIIVESGCSPAATLTRREVEVLQLMARGYTNRQIASALTVTSHTIKVHIDHILAKFGARNRTEAAVAAADLGYLALSRVPLKTHTVG